MEYDPIKEDRLEFEDENKEEDGPDVKTIPKIKTTNEIMKI